MISKNWLKCVHDVTSLFHYLHGHVNVLKITEGMGKHKMCICTGSGIKKKWLFRSTAKKVLIFTFNLELNREG